MYKEALHTIKLSIPIVIGELIQMAITIIGIGMVGKLSYLHLAAASLINSIVNVFFIIGVGISLSILQQVASNNGAKKYSVISHYLFNGIILLTILSFSFSISIYFGAPYLHLLGLNEELIQIGIPYLQIMGWALIPLLVSLSLRHFFDGLGKTQTTLIFSILTLPINIFFNWVFVFGNFGFAKLGLNGIGVAYFVSNMIIIAAMLSVIGLGKYFHQFTLQHKYTWKLNLKTIKSLYQIGIPISIQLGIEILAFAISGLLIGKENIIHQAAYQITFSCMIIILMMNLALAQGNSIRVSKAWGEKDYKKIDKITKSSIFISIIFSSFCTVIMLIFSFKIPFIFNSNINVVNDAASLLIFASLFQFINSLQIIISSTLRAIKDVKYSTLYTLIAFWLIGLPIEYGLLKLGLGVKSIWIGFSIGLAYTVILFYKRFIKIIYTKVSLKLP